MCKSVLLIGLLFVCNFNYGQNDNLWKKIGAVSRSIIEKNSSNKVSSNEILYQLDEALFRKALENNQNKKIEIVIPNTNGDLEKFQISESSNFDPVLQAKYPEIRAYSGKGITDKNATINFSLSPRGIQTMILRADNGSEFIEPFTGETSTYKLFSSKTRTTGRLPFSCKTEDKITNNSLFNKTSKVNANNQSFRTFRLALSCTAEYTAFYGGTVAGALAAMNATMTRVNGVFNNDLAVKLEIIANNDLIIYTDATTDPYSDASEGAGTSSKWNQELQTNLTTIIGEVNYDIGHLFGASGSGGNAGCIGCVCENPTVKKPLGKGSGYTSPADGNAPQGDTFDIDFVAHEMGHQLGANHTFSYDLEGTGVQVEPGSGSTIMGYAGITDYDVQINSDDYFSYASINQIQANLATKSCGTSTSTSPNLPPTVNAGLDWTIPKGTAFVLTGTGSDSNGDALTYSWEENDSVITQDQDNSIAFPTKVDGPLFRSLYPSSSPIRYMPSFANVLDGKIFGTWESVSSIARTLHFVLTARDYATSGKGQTNTDAMIVDVSGTVGPFTVTSQNTTDIGWSQGSSQTITWSVNSSNTLVGSANVNIKLSTDGGLTFPMVLASNTPNDGSEIITVPNVASTNCRILIEPTANIYYAVNSKSFAIGYSPVTTCNTYTFPLVPFSIPESASYATRVVSVPVAGTVSSVSLAVGFKHSYLSDVQIDVESPVGTIVKLFERSCGNTDGALMLNYDDLGGILDCGSTTLQTVAPYESFSAFKGQGTQGNWTFRIRDAYAKNTGTLNSASITICTQIFTTLDAPNFSIDDFVMYPNPNKGIFNIKFTSNSSEKIKVFVYDLIGRKIYENQFENNGSIDEKIDLKNIQSATYLLIVMDGDRKIEKKILLDN